MKRDTRTIDEIKLGLKEDNLLGFSKNIKANIEQISRIVAAPKTATEFDLNNFEALIKNGIAQAEKAMELLASPDVSRGYHFDLFEALSNLEKLYEDVLRKESASRLMKAAGLTANEQKRFRDAINHVHEFKQVLITQNKILTQNSGSKLMAIKDPNFTKSIKILGDVSISKPIKKALLNIIEIHPGMKADSLINRNMMDEMLKQDTQVVIAYKDGKLPLREWIYKTGLYGDKKEQRSVGIIRDLRLQKLDVLSNEKEISKDKVERYSRTIKSVTDHKIKISADQIDFAKLDKDSVANLLKGDQLKFNDILKNLQNIQIDVLQAKDKDGKTLTQKLFASQTLSKDQLVGLANGFMQKAFNDMEKQEWHKDAIESGIKTLIEDALRADCLSADGITLALERDFITLDTLKGWAKDGLITERILSAEITFVDPNTGKEREANLQNYLISNEVLVGKSGKHIADWLDKKYPDAATNLEVQARKEEDTKDVDVKARDLDVLAIENKLITLNRELNQRTNEKTRHINVGKEMRVLDELEREIEAVKRELADVVSEGVKKDIKDNRSNTVLNKLNFKSESSKFDIFNAALQKVTKTQFAQLSGRLKPKHLQFIVENAIPIGPDKQHPLLTFKDVNMYLASKVEGHNYDYIINSLQTAMVDKKGRPVERGSKDAIPLLQYMHNKKGFQFGNPLDAKQLRNTINNLKTEEIILELRSQITMLQEIERLTGDIKEEKIAEYKSEYGNFKTVKGEMENVELELRNYEPEFEQAIKNSVVSPYVSKNPLEAVLKVANPELINVEAIAQMEFTTSEILAYLDENNQKQISTILMNKMQKRENASQILDEVLEYGLKHPKQKDLLKEVYSNCQIMIVAEEERLFGIKDEAIKEFGYFLGAVANKPSVTKLLVQGDANAAIQMAGLGEILKEQGSDIDKTKAYAAFSKAFYLLDYDTAIEFGSKMRHITSSKDSEVGIFKKAIDSIRKIAIECVKSFKHKDTKYEKYADSISKEMEKLKNKDKELEKSQGEKAEIEKTPSVAPIITEDMVQEALKGHKTENTKLNDKGSEMKLPFFYKLFKRVDALLHPNVSKNIEKQAKAEISEAAKTAEKTAKGPSVA